MDKGERVAYDTCSSSDKLILQLKYTLPVDELRFSLPTMAGWRFGPGLIGGGMQSAT